MKALNFKSILKRRWLRWLIVTLLLLAAVSCILGSSWLSHSLLSQQAAARWAGDSDLEFAQVSYFLPVDKKVLCSMFSALIFIGLAAVAAPLLDKPLPRAVCAKAAKLSYAVFLTHHVIIQRLVRGFDLAALSRRDTAILFCVYLLATYAASEALLWLQCRLREERQKLFP